MIPNVEIILLSYFATSLFTFLEDTENIKSSKIKLFMIK